MMFTSYLLNIPPVILLLLVVLAFSAFSFAITWLYRRYHPTPRVNDAGTAGVIYGVMGGIYGLLLAFVIVLVWGDYSDTQGKAAEEQSLAVSLYREITFFPDSAEIRPLRQAYIAYIHSVLETEYPAMRRLKPFPESGQKYIDNVYRQLELLNKSDDRSNKMVEHLDELALYRNLRQMDAMDDIPVVIWMPLLLGYLILVVCSLYLGFESIRWHLLMNSLTGALTGVMVFIVLLVDHPFSGSLQITPDQYQAILQMEKNLPY